MKRFAFTILLLMAGVFVSCQKDVLKLEKNRITRSHFGSMITIRESLQQ